MENNNVERSFVESKPREGFLESFSENFENTAFMKLIRSLDVDHSSISPFGELLTPVCLSYEWNDRIQYLEIVEIPPGAGYVLINIVDTRPEQFYSSGYFLDAGFWQMIKNVQVIPESDFRTKVSSIQA